MTQLPKEKQNNGDTNKSKRTNKHGKFQGQAWTDMNGETMAINALCPILVRHVHNKVLNEKALRGDANTARWL